MSSRVIDLMLNAAAHDTTNTQKHPQAISVSERWIAPRGALKQAASAFYPIY
jgi:hypothetical protein